MFQLGVVAQQVVVEMLQGGRCWQVEVTNVQAQCVQVRLHLLFIAHLLHPLRLQFAGFLALHHPVLSEEDEGLLAVLIGVESVALLHVVLPVALITGPIGVVKHSETLPHSGLPVALVAIAQVLALAPALEPDVNSPPLLLVVLPVADVLFPDVGPVHGAHAALHVGLPVAFEVVTRGVVVHLAVAVLHVVLEAALKDASALELDLALPRLLPLSPLPLIGCVVDAVPPHSMSQSVPYLPVVATAVGPAVVPPPRDAVVSELSLVYDAVGPGEFALPVEQPVVKVAFVLVAVLECHFSWPVEALPVYFAVLGRGRYLPLPVLVEDLGELDRQHHAAIHRD